MAFPSPLSLLPSLLLPHPPKASDNHIGYMEKDPVRCNDSLESFEEVLRIAKDQEVTQHPGFVISTSTLGNSSIEKESHYKQACRSSQELKKQETKGHPTPASPFYLLSPRLWMISKRVGITISGR